MKTTSKMRMTSKPRYPKKMMRVVVSVPKQCFQPLISFKVVNDRLALLIGTILVWVRLVWVGSGWLGRKGF